MRKLAMTMVVLGLGLCALAATGCDPGRPPLPVGVAKFEHRAHQFDCFMCHQAHGALDGGEVTKDGLRLDFDCMNCHDPRFDPATNP